MRVESNQVGEGLGGKASFLGRMISNPTTLLLVVLLFILIAAGWQKSDGFTVAVAVLGVPILVGVLIKSFGRTDFSPPRFFNGTAKQLAWIRIIVCLSAFILTVVEDLPATAHLPVDFRGTSKLFHLLNGFPGYATLLSHSELLGVLQWTTALLVLAGLVGWGARVTLLVGGLCFFLMQAILRQYTYSFHTGLLPLYLLFVLPWTPCAAAWSFDCRSNPAKRAASRQSIGFGVYACFAVMAVIYLFCGLSKLRDSGLDWFQGENIQHKLLQDTLEPIFLDHHWKATIWLVQHDTPQFVYSLIGIVGVAAELGYFTVLFSRTARIVMPVVAFGVHLGILVLQHILFLDLLILQLVFLNADRLGAFAVRRFRFRGKGEGSPRAAHHGKERRPVPLVAFASMAIMIAGLFVIWVFRIEYYPFSSWHMYSKRESNTPIFYYKMVATLEDGRSITLPRRDYCPAVMPNSRTILHKAFNKSSQSGSFDQFLSDYVERRNRKLAFGSPISSIEVQRWKWNYAVDPHDPRFGWITHRYLYNAVTKQAGRAALSDNDWTNSQTSLGRISMANLQY